MRKRTPARRLEDPGCPPAGEGIDQGLGEAVLRGPHDLLVLLPRDDLGVARAARRIARAWGARHVRVPDLDLEVGRGPGPSESQRREVSAITRAAILVLEGLFAARSCRELAGCFAILHGRRVGGRPTAVITAEPLDAIRERYPDFHEILSAYETIDAAGDPWRPVESAASPTSPGAGRANGRRGVSRARRAGAAERPGNAAGRSVPVATGGDDGGGREEAARDPDVPAVKDVAEGRDHVGEPGREVAGQAVVGCERDAGPSPGRR